MTSSDIENPGAAILRESPRSQRGKRSDVRGNLAGECEAPTSRGPADAHVGEFENRQLSLNVSIDKSGLADRTDAESKHQIAHQTIARPPARSGWRIGLTSYLGRPSHRGQVPASRSAGAVNMALVPMLSSSPRSLWPREFCLGDKDARHWEALGQAVDVMIPRGDDGSGESLAGMPSVNSSSGVRLAARVHRRLLASRNSLQRHVHDR
jgi:hypothetical protein